VVVTYNSEELLPDCIASLLAVSTDDIDLEIIISDNASADDSIAVAKAMHPDVTVVASETNAGYAAGINAGVRAGAPSDAILVLNDDIRVSSDTVEKLLDAIGRPGVGIAVPKLIDGSGELLKSLRREPSLSRVFGEAILGGDRAGRISALGEVVQDESAYEEQSVVTWASGCAWLISRECWDAVGEWDESYFLYGEDSDYALRTRDAGYVMQFIPDASVVHLVGPSHVDPRLWTMSVWNRYRQFDRRHGRVQSTFFRLGLLFNEGIRAVAGRSAHRAAAEAILDPRKLPEEVQ